MNEAENDGTSSAAGVQPSASQKPSTQAAEANHDQVSIHMNQPKNGKQGHLEPLLSNQTRQQPLDQNESFELAHFGGASSPANEYNPYQQDNTRKTEQSMSQVSQSNISSAGVTLSKSQVLRNAEAGGGKNFEANYKQTRFDYLKIFMYHYIEAILLAAAMGLSMQLPTLSTLIYVIIMFLGLLPMLISSNSTNVKFKLFLCCLMLTVALPLFVFKLVMIIQYNKDATKFDQHNDVWKFLGVFCTYPGVTLSIDLIQAVISSLLIWHLSDQRRQATERMQMDRNMNMQTKIKLHHPIFGDKNMICFVISYGLYLLDAFVMMSVPQLLIITLLLVLMFFWNHIVVKRSVALYVLIRTIQVLSVLQLLFAFFIQLPIVADQWQANHKRLVNVMGLMGVDDFDNISSQHEYDTYSRFHRVILSFAVVSTEVFFVSSSVYAKLLKKAKEATLNSAMNLSPGSQQRLASSEQQQPFARQFSQSSALRNTSRVSVTGGNKMSQTVNNRVTMSHVSRLQRSQLLTQKSAPMQNEKKVKSCCRKLVSWWRSVSSALPIWLCRLILFIWAYMYHDIQSVFLLLWIVHSTIFTDSPLFRKWIIFFYLPIVTSTFIWYYLINIFGLLPRFDSPNKSDPTYIDNYTFGFFLFNLPFLEIGFMFSGIASLCLLANQLGKEVENKKFENLLISKIGNKNAAIGNQFLFLFLRYIEYPMMLFLVIAGLDKMDVYHIVMLLFFVWYTLNPQIIQKWSIYLLIYADLFVLEKYCYSLFYHAKNDPANWLEILGLSTDYNEHSPNEYWRYRPRFDQWVLVGLTFCLYRRQHVLGTGDDKKFDEYTRKAENQIKLRMPRFHRFVIILDIIYTYTIVMVAFILYLVIITIIPATLINCLTQTLVLILLCIYLSSGIKKLLGYWNLLIFYQAIVLILMVVFQFLVQSPGWETSKIKKFFDQWPDWWDTWIKWLGFVKYDDPINLKLLPYVIFFSLAVILQQNFKTKNTIERRLLYTFQDVEPPQSGNMDQKQFSESLLLQIEHVQQQERIKKLEQMMRLDPTGEYQQVENELVYNYGHVSGLCRDQGEILHYKQTLNMKYKMSYMVFKMQKWWYIFDTAAAYFYLLFYVSVLSFALYYQLALFWAIALTIYMFAQIINSRQNYKYRQSEKDKFNSKLQEQVRKESFIEQHHASADLRSMQTFSDNKLLKSKEKAKIDKRLMPTEDQVLADRESKILIRIERRTQLDQLRNSKNSMMVHKNSAMNQQRMESARFGGQYELVPMNDQNKQLVAKSHDEQPKVEIEDEFEVLVKEKEGKNNHILKVTDKEVLEEYQDFCDEIHRVTLQSRYFAWLSMMILLIIGLAMIYISSFADLYDQTDTLFSTSTKQRLIFIFFWAGVYSDSDYSTYASAVYPFYVLLVLLVLERLAQLWTESRFGCDEEQIKKFKLVEREDKIFYNQAKERKRLQEKASQFQRRTQTQKLVRSTRLSVTSSNADINNNNNFKGDEDSFKTDSDMKDEQSSHASKQLLTIEEDQDESLRNSQRLDRSNRPANRSMSEYESRQQKNHQSVGQPSSGSINASFRERDNPADSYSKATASLVHPEEEVKATGTSKRAPILIVQESTEIKPLSVIPESESVSRTKLTIDTDDGELRNWEKRDKLKQELIKELKPILNINSRLRLYKALKSVLENICILLVWFSCIYKQNILSMAIFIVLVIYTYRRSRTTLLLVRTTIVILFVVQYWLEVLNLSQYNSPKQFPNRLIGTNPDYTVYPNPLNYYFNIPIYFSFNEKQLPDGNLSASANLLYSSYLSMDADSRKLNGVWIDFAMSVVVAIYFSFCNFWMLYRPVKIVRSEETEEKLRQYAKIMRIETGKKYKKFKHVARDLKQQFGMSKLVKGWQESLFETFPIILIAFTLAISIFNQSILSFGYIIFVMILVFDSIKFLNKGKRSENIMSQQERDEQSLQDRSKNNRLMTTLKYFMLPYLLFDILFQLVYSMPIEAFENTQKWAKAVGFERVWNISPATLNLGDNFAVIYSIDASLASMMLKGVTFFFISIQLQLLDSYQYKKYIQYRREHEAEWKEKVGRGITYRFNNFKSKAVLKQAKETQQVERMLWHVKRLIRKRQELYKKAHTRQNTNQVRTSSRNSKLKHIKEIDVNSERSSSEDDYNKKLEHRIKTEKQIIKKDYEKRMKQLNNCNKFYLWIRKNYVVDLLFRKSEEELDDMVKQMESGRTNIKTSVEIGTHNISKKERKVEVEKQLNELLMEQAKSTTGQKIDFKVKGQDLESDDSPSSDELLKDKQIHGEVENADKQGPRVIFKTDENSIVEEIKEQVIVEETDRRRGDSQSALLEVMETDKGGVRDSADFNKRLSKMIVSLAEQEKKVEKAEKNLYADLLKSNVYRQSTKPWEIVNTDEFLTTKRSLSRYLVVIYKSLVSYSELFCYIWMIIATLMKAGWLYMVYPVSIFGFCMCEEQRPGKVFWFFILFYTQALLILNFMMQLSVWDVVLTEEQRTNYLEFFNRNRLGIQKIQDDSFGSIFAFYFPEIFILFTVLVHIQKESLSGVFNVPYESYENFEQGLLRYRLQVLCTTNEEKAQVNIQFNQEEALKVKLDRKTIEEYQIDRGYYSEYDKFEWTERIKDPIRREKLFKDPLQPFGEKDMMVDFLYQARDSDVDMKEFNSTDVLLTSTEEENQLKPLNVLVDQVQNDAQSDEENAPPYKPRSEDNWIYYNKDRKTSYFKFREWARWLFIDNPFMNRLFPDIKQQKPGLDLYVYVATIQIVMIAYTFLFYSNMQGNESDIATQFASNQYSSNMVILIIIMMGIMAVDRVLYSTHAFLSGTQPIYDQNLNVGFQGGVNHQNRDHGNVNETSIIMQSIDTDASMLHRQSGQPYARTTQALYNVDSEKKQTNLKNNWIEEQFAMSENESDSEDDQFQYNNHLVPQKQQRTFFRVFKFYWFWFVILVSHYFVFFGLPSTIQYCKDTVQLSPQKNQYVKYGEPGYQCNTFTNNGWIITFYLFLCVYLSLQAFQMRIGLPEIRKGSFLMESFNPVSGVIYRGYLGIPFIFELRTLIDWTFTTTALDAFQWIKLAQIQANMYVAKCVNKDYMERELGTRIKKWEKIVVGFGLVLFILFMIVGPIILFSQLNPIAIIDNPTGGQLSVSLMFADTIQGTNQTLPIFQTQQVTQIKQITQSQYNNLNFGNNSETTAAFGTSQIQIVQFSATSDYSWIISQPKRDEMVDYLFKFANDTIEPNIQLIFRTQYTFQRENSQYGSASNEQSVVFANNTEFKTLANTLGNQINCTQSSLQALFPANLTITQKTSQDQQTMIIPSADPAFRTNYTLTYYCNPGADDMSQDYWKLVQNFTSNEDLNVQSEIQYMEGSVFYGEGFGFFLFQQKVMPGFFGSYSANLVVFYVGIVLIVASFFRSVFVPRTWEIYIIDAPFTEDILKICQSIHVYRVQRDLEKEEELYQILIDIMRSPEMIKALCGDSLKKKLQ